MAAHHTLLRFLPEDIVEKILEFNFPRKRWVKYWKNQAMELILSSGLNIKPRIRIHNMNLIYLDNLTYDVLENHIEILGEISYDYENVADPDFNTLISAIRNTIRNSVKITRRQLQKMAPIRPL